MHDHGSNVSPNSVKIVIRFAEDHRPQILEYYCEGSREALLITIGIVVHMNHVSDLEDLVG